MKWGILATGNIAKKFASTINQMSKENEQLVAVGSRNIENAKAFANEHDIPRYYDSYEALVKDQEFDLFPDQWPLIHTNPPRPGILPG